MELLLIVLVIILLFGGGGYWGGRRGLGEILSRGEFPSRTKIDPPIHQAPPSVFCLLLLAIPVAIV